MKRYFAAVAATLLCSGQAIGGTHIGTIHTLQVNLKNSLAYVKFNEAVTFTGGTTCSSTITANSVDDDRFMNLVWPVLIMAKSRNLSVRIDTEACLNGYPTIYAVETEAR